MDDPKNILNTEFAKYFESKGFEVDWNIHNNQFYYEIFLDNKLLVQVDIDLDLAPFLEDLKILKDVGDGEIFKSASDQDYIINSPPEDLEIFLNKLFKE